ncbi:MAG: hypothetical protein J6R00_10220 [Lentisphaeria bacterium]|nr:hypothetical protein [Lentisphaeria bacterium]
MEFLKESKIEHISLYFLQVDVKREFSYGSWPRRFHCVVELASQGKYGYGEICIPETDQAPFSAAEYKDLYSVFAGLAFDEAYRRTVALRGSHPNKVLESVEMALIDLQGKVTGVPAVKLLGLEENTAVSGLYCILQHDPEKLVGSAQKFMARTQVTHIKLKLFGEIGHDCKLVKTLRQTVGKECFIAGDVNDGYPADIAVLVPAMKALVNSGLDACEDPAAMPWEMWQELQKSVPELHLIPDLPMRPAYETVVTARLCSGMIGNLHPDCMGSLIAASELGKRLKKEDIPVMIGDDSLVAAGCTAWQQVASAIGARWVEALEKPDEFSRFADCVKSSATYVDKDGRYAMTPEVPGFGLELDREKLRSISAYHYVI